MKSRYLLGAGVALAMMLGGAGARAQLVTAPSGPGTWYFGGEGGWTSLSNASNHAAGVPFSEHFGDGFNVGARAGYEWGPLRFEEEFSWRRNGISGVDVGGLHLPTNGNRNAYAFMTNAIYDFNFGWPVTPHVGVGVGAVELRDAWSIPGIGTMAHSDDWQFGYQAIAGIRYNINPSLAFDLDYRYLATTDPTFHFGGGGAAATGISGVAYKSEYSSNSLLASLTMRFGAPPPPPVAAPPAPPAPPPVVRKVFLVFFDWDKDTITSEGMKIVQQASAAWHAGAPVTIQVTGYTDRSGSAGYNQRLSERRANNVARAMEHLGVPRSDMVVAGRGENDNRVPTANGVREPQNRRVEIVFP